MAGQARVVVVVDDGEGGADHAVATCVVVPRGTTGAQLLARRAALVGAAVPGHAGSGLLCTIDSFPASQCAETGSGSYWANFSGTGGGWNYSSYNPFIRRVCDGDVEGWRYVVHGSGAAGDSQPRLDPASVRPTDAWGCSEPASNAAVGGVEPATDPGAVSGAGSTSSPPISPSTDVAADPAADPSLPADGSADGVAGTGRSTTRAAGAAVSGADTAESSASAAQDAGTTSLWGAVLAVVVIVGLGAAAALRSRRRA